MNSSSQLTMKEMSHNTMNSNSNSNNNSQSTGKLPMHHPSLVRRSSFAVPLLDNSSASQLPQQQQLLNILQGITALNLLKATNVDKSRKLVTIPDDSTLSHAVWTLSRHRILSCPVINHSENVCVGVIDSLTIIDFLMKCNIVHKPITGNEIKSDSSVPKSLSRKNSLVEPITIDRSHLNKISLEDIQSIDFSVEMTPEQVSSTPIRQVMKSSTRTSLKPVFEHLPVTMLLQLFASGLHRVALISEAFEIKNICSQSDMIILLLKLMKENKLIQLATVNVKDLPMIHHERILVTRSSDSTTKQCLESMDKHNVTSVGIIDSDTQSLIAEFSSSDLRGLSDFTDIHMNVLDYLHKYNPSSLQPLTCEYSNSLSDILTMLTKCRNKRVWIVDPQNNNKPLNVITSTDLCKVILGDTVLSTVTDRELNGDISYSKLWIQPEAHVHHVNTEPQHFQFIYDPKQ